MGQIFVFIDPSIDRFGGILGVGRAKLGFNPNELTRIYCADSVSQGYVDFEAGFESTCPIVLVPDALMHFEYSPLDEFKVVTHSNTPWEPVKKLIPQGNCKGMVEGREVSDDPYYPRVAKFIWDCYDKNIKAAEHSFSVLWNAIPDRNASKEDVITSFLSHCSSFESAQRLLGNQGYVGDSGVKFIFESTLRNGQEVSDLAEAIVENGVFNSTAYEILAQKLWDH